MREKLNAVPLWFINLLSIISAIITILSPIVVIISAVRGQFTYNILAVATIITLLAFILLLLLRMRKYRKLAFDRMSITSENYHRFLHRVRNVYFDVMYSHKKNTLNENQLSTTYKTFLSAILDNLCDIMESFTGRKVSACIKLISYSEDEEIINVDNAKLITFCRSAHSDTGREVYEEATKGILLKENTDYLEIVSTENAKNYFYQGDLERYSKKLEEVGKSYNNTDKNWSKFYKGAIVVPIQIKCKRLYDQNRDEAWHIIGFLRVDSLSKDAFMKKQEKYNVDILRSYSDVMYILLGQYKHYLKKLTNPDKSNGV